MNFEGLSISVYFLDDVSDVMDMTNEAEIENTRNMYVEALRKLVFKHGYMPRTGDAIYGFADRDYFYVAEVAFEEQRICFYLTTKDIVQQLTATN